MGPQEAKLPRLSSGPWVLTPVCFAQRGPISPGRGACQALATRELWRPTDQTPLTEGAGGRSRKRLSCAGRTAIRQQSGPPRLAPQVLPQLGPGSGWPSPAHSRQGTYPVAPPGSEGGMGPSSRIFPLMFVSGPSINVYLCCMRPGITVEHKRSTIVSDSEQLIHIYYKFSSPQLTLLSPSSPAYSSRFNSL